MRKLVRLPDVLRSVLTFLVLLFFTLSSLPLSVQAQIGWPKEYKNGIVVSADEIASQVGVDMLRKGGNAIDAAVAVNFALAVTYPQAGNIGGGGFMVVHLANDTTTTLDFREVAPRAADRDMYLDEDGHLIEDRSTVGALASGVPGSVDGMLTALRRYGNFPIEIVLEPAIELADQGFPISNRLAQTLNNYRDELSQYKATENYFTKASGRPYAQGDSLIQSDLAETLRRIARFGRDGFYSGQTADYIVETMNEHGGLIDYLDLTNYQSKWRPAIQAGYKGYTLHMMPPPSSGSIAIRQMLDMANSQGLDTLSYHSANYVHVLTESMRRAFADRAYYLGDPDFVDIPSQAITAGFYSNDRMRSFSWNRATLSDSVSHGNLPGFGESRQTTHFSVVDGQGNAVAITTTLNGSFGSKLAVDGAGFLLNNEMDDFSSKPGVPNQFGLIGGEANAIEPGKRMLSSMTPTIVTRNNRAVMVLGAAGGPRIINTVLQNFLNMAQFDMNAQEAIAAPRFHHQWLPDKLSYEQYGLSPDTRAKLRAMGHNLDIMGSIGRGHIVRIRPDGTMESGVDPRGNGAAAGY
ncbi:MAG: gamma-glutamyltransferase [Bacteroidota bacterium]